MEPDDDTLRNEVLRAVGGPLAAAAQELERILAEDAESAEDTEPDPCDNTTPEG